MARDHRQFRRPSKHASNTQVNIKPRRSHARRRNGNANNGPRRYHARRRCNICKMLCTHRPSLVGGSPDRGETLLVPTSSGACRVSGRDWLGSIGRRQTHNLVRASRPCDVTHRPSTRSLLWVRARPIKPHDRPWSDVAEATSSEKGGVGGENSCREPIRGTPTRTPMLHPARAAMNRPRTCMASPCNYAVICQPPRLPTPPRSMGTEPISRMCSGH